MNIRDLIPWSRGREVQVRREGADYPTGVLQSDIDRVFEDFWRRFGMPMPGIWGDGDGTAGGLVPRVDVRGADNALEVKAELPGMAESDIDVSLAPGRRSRRTGVRWPFQEGDPGLGVIAGAA